MKKVFTSILLLAALSVPAYLSASAWLEGDGDQQEQGGGDGGDATDFAEGKYYIYNAAAGGYIVGGNNWGTRASISKTGGIEFEAVLVEGKYELKSAPLYDGKHLGFNGYVDNGDADQNWTITPVEGQEGVYTLATADGNVLFWDGGDATTTSVGAMPETAANAYWQLISSADRLASLASADADNSIDATFLIGNPNFSRSASNAAWTMEASNQNLSGGANENTCAESWRSAFTLSQELTVPNGVYALTAQAALTDYTGAYDGVDYPVVYANEETSPFIAMEESDRGTSMTTLSGSFSAGKYVVGPILVEVTDGVLTVGVKGTRTDTWCIWDNFQLTYYGTEATIDEVRFAGLIAQLAELKADATALKDNEYITAAAITEIETAIAATEAEMTTEDDYNTAIATMQDVIKAANQAIKDNKIVVTGIVPDNELDNWACTNSNTFHINTWSTEGNSDGSEMKTPFIENWVGKPGPLGEGDITYTVPGTFEKGLVAQVSALIRIYSESGAEPAGASFFVNNDTVSIAEIGESFEYNEMKGVYANIKVKGAIGEDGKLIFGVNIAEPTFNWVAIKSVNFKVADETTIAYENALAAIKDGEGYRVFTEVEGTKYYLNSTGFLTDDTQKAATFEFNKVEGANETLYLAGWNLGVKFTNPNLTNGSTGDVVNDGHIHNGNNDRDNWERQVFFMNEDGKFAVRSTNANSANWGANTYWDVITEEELPAAGYSLEPAYVWQIEGFVDKRPEAFAKTQAWPMKLQKIEGLVKDAANWTSNAQEPNEGPIKNLIDMNTGTFFHSIWSATGPDEAHYIEATLPDAVEKFYISFIKRNDSNRPTQIDVSGGESEVQTITEGLPAAGWYTTAVNLTAPANVVRFSVPTTNNGTPNNGHQFFSMAEFYILPSNELTDAAAQYMVASYTDLDTDESVIEAINDIDAQIAALEAQIDLAADIEALAALADKFKAEIEATDNYIDATGSAAGTASAVITEVKGGTYTSIDEIEAAKAQLIAAAKTFYANVEPVEALDISDWFIVNPIAVAHKALPKGWEGDTFGDSSDGVSEYWNKAAASFHQTINLPAGSYKLTAVALQRTDMTGYVYAGEKQTTIVGVESSVANSRAQAAAWFAAGNGENEVWFTLDEAADVEIGIKADEANGDHWTVWQSFKLEKAIAPVPAGDTYAGIIMQSLSHPQHGVIGESTSDQTVTITEAGEGLVNITFSGFTLPAMPLSFDEFTIENVAVTEYEGVTVYLADDFQVSTGGQMPAPYNGTLIGAQETAESTPVIKLILQNATTDVCYFGANEEDINRFKERETANNDYSFTVERYAGMGYTPTEAAIDDETFAEIKTVLGVEELTTDMLSFVNPNGTEISYADYMTANYDGWCDAEGTATNWGDNTAICVKFFEALSEGKYSICDMNGADEIGKEYKVTWKLTNGNNSVTYTTVVKFVEAPEVQMTISENVIKASVIYTTDEASYVEKSVELTQEQISAICDELGVESIEGLDVYGYNPSNAELLTNYAGFDGWRDANGDFHSWTGSDAAPACVKFTDGKTYLCYNINGCQPQTVKCYWAIATESKAVLIEISFTYQYPDGINGVAADVENGKVFNIAGQKTGRVQKGVNIIGGKKVYVK